MMEPADLIKLIYQNEFGPGHFVNDPSLSMKRLIAEMESTPTNSTLPLKEDIGNGLVRVNLAAMSEHYMTPEQLNRAFVKSANSVCGSVESFEEKLKIAYRIVKEKNKLLSFSADALRHCLEEYSKVGYPPVSHSKTYKEIYAPAYRVVLNVILEEIT